jgi:hypothetical protein
MATSFSALMGMSFSINYQNLNDFNNAVDNFTKSYTYSLTDGTAANQAQKLFRDQRTVTTGANDDLDLAGVLLDSFGQTLTFTAIKGIWVFSLTTNTTNLTIGAGANPFATWLGGTTPTVGPIVPGGALFVYRPDAAGYTVTAGTGDILRIANSAGASAVYDIAIIGEG